MRRIARSLALLTGLLAAVVLVPSSGSVAAPARIMRLPTGGADAMSDAGRFVVFTSDAPMVATDTNGDDDVYVLDRSTGAIRRVSVSSSEHQANGPSSAASVSADGRFVAFVSSATNLVANDTNGVQDVFLRDRSAGTTTRVSVTNAEGQATGPSYRPAISGDGTIVAFRSDAPNLGASQSSLFAGVYVRDVAAGTTQLVGSLEWLSIGNEVALSEDGRSVVWKEEVSGTSGDCEADRLFVYDRSADTTKTYGGDCIRVLDFSISGDGNLLGWTSLGVSAAGEEAVLLDRATGAEQTLPGSGIVIARDGNVAFTGGPFLRAIDTDTMRIEVLRVAVRPFAPVDATASGGDVLVTTDAPNLVAGDRGVTPDAFVVGAGQPPPTPLIARGDDAAIAPDGRIVVVATVEDPTGDVDVAVLRYTAAGALDPSFTGDGITFLDVADADARARAVAVQPDGSILVGLDVSPLRDRVVRLRPDGFLDTAFASQGRYLLSGELADLLARRDGRIVLSETTSAGSTLWCLVNEWTSKPCDEVKVTRLTSTGAPDPTFSGGSVRVAFELDPSSREGQDLTAGEIATYGGDYFVVTSEGVIKISATGVRDTDYGTGEAPGFARTSCQRDIVIQDGVPVVGGSFGIGFCAVRLTADGHIDSSFGSSGTAEVQLTGNAGSALLAGIRSDGRGRLVLAGWADPRSAFPRFAVVRLTPGGALDASFSADGVRMVSPARGGWSRGNALVLTAGRILIAGDSAPAWDRSLEIGLVELAPSGNPASAFGDGDGRVTTLFTG